MQNELEKFVKSEQFIESIRQVVREEQEKDMSNDIDTANVTVEMVREIIREEFPALLARSITTIEGNLQLLDSRNIIVGSTTGSKVGTSTTQKLGFFNASPVIRQTDGAGLTNSVTAGGTTDTIANYTDLSTYANDAAAIRNDIYQLARKVKTIGDALRLYGFLS